jgi:hypothetical protein
MGGPPVPYDIIVVRMKYRTVQLKLTNPKENIADLMNLLSIVSFRARWPEKYVKESFERVLDEQYLQSVLNSPQKEAPVLNKPTELS